ncbi:tRNA synthetases class I family protein, partial [Vibrio parahaemolyticus V-223/04]
TVTLKWVN